MTVQHDGFAAAAAGHGADLAIWRVQAPTAAGGGRADSVAGRDGAPAAASADGRADPAGGRVEAPAPASDGRRADSGAGRAEGATGDPVGEYTAAAERVLRAFAADGVLSREFALPEIDPKATFPGGLAISFHFVDYVVHGWDVARALGVGYELDDEVLDVALAIAQAVPDDETRRRPGAAFAPAVPVDAGAVKLDRVVARLGRRPDWSPVDGSAR
jgi:uncharacterized protein (TIGR03086 family)